MNDRPLGARLARILGRTLAVELGFALTHLGLTEALDGRALAAAMLSTQLSWSLAAGLALVLTRVLALVVVPMVAAGLSAHAILTWALLGAARTDRAAAPIARRDAHGVMRSHSAP